jgi:hypothetical protein
MNGQDHMLAQLRRRYPGMGRKCDHENSRSSAIKLMCKQCMGGQSSLVRDCPSANCPLWQYRGSGATENPDVPSLDDYAEMSTGQGNTEALEAWRSQEVAHGGDSNEPA